MKRLVIIGALIAGLLTGVNAGSVTAFKGIKKCKLKVKQGRLIQRGFCPKWVVENSKENIDYDVLK